MAAAFDESSVIQALPKGIDSICEAGSWGASEKSDYWHRGLLRARRERPRRRGAAEQRDDLAPLHSITSSARARSVDGISSPSALAVLRLMTSSNFVGACTGRSAGLPPFKMRSTYDAACRHMSRTSMP